MTGFEHTTAWLSEALQQERRLYVTVREQNSLVALRAALPAKQPIDTITNLTLEALYQTKKSQHAC